MLFHAEVYGFPTAFQLTVTEPLLLVPGTLRLAGAGGTTPYVVSSVTAVDDAHPRVP